MSIFTESLPEHLLISGKKIAINSDFRIWLELSSIIGSGSLDVGKITKIFSLIFKELPPNMIEALKAATEFYSRGEKKETSPDKTSDIISKKAFDFDYDADLIYSAFMQQYRVDLCDIDMHWWKFKALLNGLTDETYFIKVVQYRSIDLSQIKDKEQKKFYRKMKATYKLPDNRSEEQKEQQLNSVMESLF